MSLYKNHSYLSLFLIDFILLTKQTPQIIPIAHAEICKQIKDKLIYTSLFNNFYRIFDLLFNSANSLSAYPRQSAQILTLGGKHLRDCLSTGFLHQSQGIRSL